MLNCLSKNSGDGDDDDDKWNNKQNRFRSNSIHIFRDHFYGCHYNANEWNVKQIVRLFQIYLLKRMKIHYVRSQKYPSRIQMKWSTFENKVLELLRSKWLLLLFRLVRDSFFSAHYHGFWNGKFFCGRFLHSFFSF